SSEYWDQWSDAEGVEVLNASEGIAEFLLKFRPRFIASWYSTVLLDGLLKGIVPVTVSGEAEQFDVVFPFRKTSLCWPEDEVMAQRLLNDEAARMAFLERSCAYVFNEP